MAPIVAQNFLGCGVPIVVTCNSLQEGAEICLEKCESEVKCDLISIYKSNSECRCSMRTIQSLITSSRVTESEIMSIDELFCDKMAMEDPSLEMMENCDGLEGCLYKSSDVFTIAKDSNIWSFVDKCKLRITSNLRSGGIKRKELKDEQKIVLPDVKKNVKPHKSLPGLSSDDKGKLENKPNIEAQSDIKDKPIPSLNELSESFKQLGLSNKPRELSEYEEHNKVFNGFKELCESKMEDGKVYKCSGELDLQ